MKKMPCVSNICKAFWSSKCKFVVVVFHLWSSSICYIVAICYFGLALSYFLISLIIEDLLVEWSWIRWYIQKRRIVLFFMIFSLIFQRESNQVFFKKLQQNILLLWWKVWRRRHKCIRQWWRGGWKPKLSLKKCDVDFSWALKKIVHIQNMSITSMFRIKYRCWNVRRRGYILSFKV